MKLLSHASLLLGLLLSGCVHMTSVSTTSIPVDRDNTVEAEGYRFMIMLLNFDNSYVDDLTRDMAEQCPDGRVEGIFTKKEDIVYFPLFAHGVRVTATGFCVTSAQPSAVPEPAPVATEPVADEPTPDEPILDEPILDESESDGAEK